MKAVLTDKNQAETRACLVWVLKSQRGQDSQNFFFDFFFGAFGLCLYKLKMVTKYYAEVAVSCVTHDDKLQV